MVLVEVGCRDVAGYGLWVDSSGLFVTTNAGLSIYDLSEPTEPVLLGKVKGESVWFAVVVAGEKAYAGGEEGFVVLDVSDLTNPRIEGKHFDGGSVYNIWISGDLAFVADDTDGLEIIDVGDPAAPGKISQVPTGGSTHGVTVVGTTAYVTDVGNGLYVVDVSDPTEPAITKRVANTRGAWGVTVVGERLYVGTFGGVLVYDISSERDPALLQRLLESHETLGACIDGTRLIASRGPGVCALDISDLNAPQELAFFAIPGGCHGLRLAHGYVYTTRKHLHVLQLREPN
jgi:hypothetical protein